MRTGIKAWLRSEKSERGTETGPLSQKARRRNFTLRRALFANVGLVQLPYRLSQPKPGFDTGSRKTNKTLSIQSAISLAFMMMFGMDLSAQLRYAGELPTAPQTSITHCISDGNGELLAHIPGFDTFFREYSEKEAQVDELESMLASQDRLNGTLQRTRESISALNERKLKVQEEWQAAKDDKREIHQSILNSLSKELETAQSELNRAESELKELNVRYLALQISEKPFDSLTEADIQRFRAEGRAKEAELCLKAHQAVTQGKINELQKEISRATWEKLIETVGGMQAPLSTLAQIMNDQKKKENKSKTALPDFSQLANKPAQRRSDPWQDPSGESDDRNLGDDTTNSLASAETPAANPTPTPLTPSSDKVVYARTFFESGPPQPLGPAWAEPSQVTGMQSAATMDSTCSGSFAISDPLRSVLNDFPSPKVVQASPSPVERRRGDFL